MAKIKQEVIQRIYQGLDGRTFSIPDFEVLFPDDSNTYVQIVFRHDPRYFFKVTEEYESTNGIATIVNQLDRKKKPHTQESPGDFKAIEWKSHNNFEEALSRIDYWIGNLKGELRAKIPALKELDELRAQLEEKFASEVPDPENQFTPSELASLVQKLNQLQEKFRVLEEEHQITKQELEIVLADIKAIKENAADLPKGLWAKVTKNRIITLIGRVVSSKEGRSFMLKAAEKILLNDFSSKQ